MASIEDLEQGWKQSNDPVDEAKLLRELVRTGALSQDRLQLAAHLGHSAARIAFGNSAPEVPDELYEWVKGFDRWGKEPLLRAAIAAARYSLPLFEAKRDDPGPRAAIEAAEAWVRDPTPENGNKAHAAAEAVDKDDESGEEDFTAGGQTFDSEMEVQVAADMAAEAAHLAGDMGEADDVAQALAATELVLNASMRAAKVTLDGTLRESIERELIPWVLGRGDPIALRSA